MKSTATVATPNAHRYMVQLCRHFGHRVPASFDQREGRITFDVGEAAMRASPDTLMMVATSPDPEGLERLEKVMESHLVRFAFREPDMAVEWRRGV
ncbi:MAG: DUF2218 domain-containing protein [Phenylobacterium sp.]|uniref:DUF2218 domain-containing protein n=1 Tax=Phenylobacterium sp. TaxID=1871053 RepID=UPI00391A2923